VGHALKIIAFIEWIVALAYAFLLVDSWLRFKGLERIVSVVLMLACCAGCIAMGIGLWML